MMTSDPKRLLDSSANDREVRLLASALDEPPPDGLLDRALAAAGAAGPVGVSGSGAAAGAAKGAALSTGGGMLGAIGVGALAGLLAVSVADYTTGFLGKPAPARTAPAAQTAAPKEMPALLPRAPASAGVHLELPEEGRRAEAGLDRALPLVKGSPPAPSGPRLPLSSPSNLAGEIALLDEARSALRRGEPARALLALERHAREFPGAQLADEAAVLRVEALEKRGDRAAAAVEARRFLSARPDSPHAERITDAAETDGGKTNR
jgi:hypothetical protein